MAARPGLDPAAYDAASSAPEKAAAQQGAKPDSAAAEPQGASAESPAANDGGPADPRAAALAAVERLPNLPPEQRAQLQRDLAQADPATLNVLTAMMTHLAASGRAGDAPPARAAELPGGDYGPAPVTALFPPSAAASWGEPATPASPVESVLAGPGAPAPTAVPSSFAAWRSEQAAAQGPLPAGSSPAGAPPAAAPPFAAAEPPPPLLAWRDHLREAIAALRRELAKPATPTAERSNQPAAVGESPGSPAAGSLDEERLRLEANLRLLLLAAGEADAAALRIERASPEEQDYWTHQVLALATLLDSDGPPIPSRRAALALKELREAAAHLAAQSTLELRNLALCTEVQGYGRYTKFSTYDFTADQEVLLYVEVDNLQATATRGGYKTVVQGSFRVLDATGRSVFDHTFPPDEETCANRRRDYFIPYRTYIPKLAAGDYTLQLTLEDTQARKFGQSTLAFRVR